MSLKVNPVFCFSPERLIPGAHPSFYIAWSYETTDLPREYSFSYIIVNETIENGNVVPKITSNNEVYSSINDLYTRYFGFLDNFPDHKKQVNYSFVNNNSQSVVKLQKVIDKFAGELAAKMGQEFYNQEIGSFFKKKIDGPKKK